MRGARAAWSYEEEDVSGRHSKARLQHAVMDSLAQSKSRVSATEASLDDLIKHARAQIAAAMVLGDFGAMEVLTDAVHEAVQALADSESTR